jgi:hypothetical protein
MTPDDRTHGVAHLAGEFVALAVYDPAAPTQTDE